MRVERPRFRDLIPKLEKMYGRLRPAVTDPFEMVLWESVAYLQTDERRAEAFELLELSVGTTPTAILKAPKSALYPVAKLGGMRPEDRVERLKEIARIAVEAFDGDVAKALDLPAPKAKKMYGKFPGIGEPGAEKILLFNGRLAVPALESNGLRVLLRLGFGEESKNYTASYRTAQKAVMEEDPKLDAAFLTRAHLALRAHGKETCKAGTPACEICPLAKGCAYYRSRAS